MRGTRGDAKGKLKEIQGSRGSRQGMQKELKEIHTHPHNKRGSAGRILNISWYNNALLEGPLELWKIIRESLGMRGTHGDAKGKLKEIQGSRGQLGDTLKKYIAACCMKKIESVSHLARTTTTTTTTR
jgi:hypothetical protein